MRSQISRKEPASQICIIATSWYLSLQVRLPTPMCSLSVSIGLSWISSSEDETKSCVIGSIEALNSVVHANTNLALLCTLWNHFLWRFKIMYIRQRNLLQRNNMKNKAMDRHNQVTITVITAFEVSIYLNFILLYFAADRWMVLSMSLIGKVRWEVIETVACELIKQSWIETIWFQNRF